MAEVGITDTIINGKLKPDLKLDADKWFKTIRADDPELVKVLEEKNLEFNGSMLHHIDSF